MVGRALLSRRMQGSFQFEAKECASCRFAACALESFSAAGQYFYDAINAIIQWSFSLPYLHEEDLVWLLQLEIGCFDIVGVNTNRSIDVGFLFGWQSMHR